MSYNCSNIIAILQSTHCHCCNLIVQQSVLLLLNSVSLVCGVVVAMLVGGGFLVLERAMGAGACRCWMSEIANLKLHHHHDIYDGGEHTYHKPHGFPL